MKIQDIVYDLNGRVLMKMVIRPKHCLLDLNPDTDEMPAEYVASLETFVKNWFDEQEQSSNLKFETVQGNW